MVTSIISEKLGEYKPFQMTKRGNLYLLPFAILLIKHLSPKGRRHFFLSRGLAGRRQQKWGSQVRAWEQRPLANSCSQFSPKWRLLRSFHWIFWPGNDRMLLVLNLRSFLGEIQNRPPLQRARGDHRQVSRDREAAVSTSKGTCYRRCVLGSPTPADLCTSPHNLPTWHRGLTCVLSPRTVFRRSQPHLTLSRLHPGNDWGEGRAPPVAPGAAGGSTGGYLLSMTFSNSFI